MTNPRWAARSFKQQKPPEKGAASIHIDLSDSVITVRHSETNEVLAKGAVKEGAWTKLWNALEEVGVRILGT